MKLPAHTNAVGTHFQNRTSVAVEQGIKFFHPFRIEEPFTYPDNVSVKSATIRGNKVDATAYHRRVSLLAEDEPGISHLVLPRIIDGVIIDDYKTTRSMSVNYNTLNQMFFPIQGLLAEENAIAKCDTECLLKLQTMKAEFGVDLIEARKTVSMFAWLAFDVAKGLRNLRRGLHFTKWGELANGKELANRWLEYQYGWKPLYQGLHDAAQAAYSSLEKDLLIYARRTVPYEVDPIQYEVHGRVNLEARVKGSVRTLIAARVSIPWMQRSSQFGLINPAAIAWELQPYSFVLDWFIPIGNVLNAVTATAGLEFVRGYYTLQREASVQKTWLPDAFAPATLIKNCRHREEHQSFGRGVHHGFPIPRYYAQDNPFSLSHVLNAAAMVRGLFK